MSEIQPSPFQVVMAELERVARLMWGNGVEGKILYQHEYLWPMATAIKAYEATIKAQEAQS